MPSTPSIVFRSDEQHGCNEHKRCTDDHDIQRIGQSHFCLLALTVGLYVFFVSVGKRILCCVAVAMGMKTYATGLKHMKLFREIFFRHY